MLLPYDHSILTASQMMNDLHGLFTMQSRANLQCRNSMCFADYCTKIAILSTRDHAMPQHF